MTQKIKLLTRKDAMLFSMICKHYDSDVNVTYKHNIIDGKIFYDVTGIIGCTDVYASINTDDVEVQKSFQAAISCFVSN